jgi:hypothetical protein
LFAFSCSFPGVWPSPKKPLLGGAARAVRRPERTVSEGQVDLLHQQIGLLSLEKDFFDTNPPDLIRGRAQRRALVEREKPALPVFQQCRLLPVSRSSVYRLPAEISSKDHTIMGLIDRHNLVRPLITARAGWRHGWRPRVKSSTANVCCV